MNKEKYVTSKLEFGSLEEATKEQLMDTLRAATYESRATTIELVLRIGNKYGEEGWNLIRSQSYETGLRRSEIHYSLIKACGDEKYLPDPRVIRKQMRFLGGSIGIVHHGNEVMEGDPATGKFKITYEIDHCTLDSIGRKMGLPSSIRQKLCYVLGNAYDVAGNDFFGMWLHEDMGLANQKPTCGFIVYGPKTREEHEAWGNSLPPELKKYYHPWPWCK